MIGKLDTFSREAAVIGAGVSGLLAAYHLHRRGYRVELFEAAPRSGGMIQTVKTPYGIAESAAHSFLVSRPVKEFFEEVGVKLAPLNPDSKARFIFRGGKPRKVPLTVFEGAAAVRRALFARRHLPKGLSYEDMSVEEWGELFLGRPAVDYLLSPFVLGVYGSLPSQLSVQAAFPSLPAPEGRPLLGSLLARRKLKKLEAAAEPPGPKHRTAMMSPLGGIGSLTQRLDEILTVELGPRFHKNCPVDKLPDVPNLLVCTDPRSAGRLLRTESPELAERLEAAEFSSIVSVTAVLDRAKFRKPVKGVGVLVPPVEQGPCLGILFNSSSFKGRVLDERRHASFTVMLGGAVDPGFVGASDARVREAVMRSARLLLGYEGEPVHLQVFRWERAIPVYSPALLKTWKLAERTWCARPGRVLFGNYSAQVSLRGLVESSRALPPPLA